MRSEHNEGMCSGIRNVFLSGCFSECRFLKQKRPVVNITTGLLPSTITTRWLELMYIRFLQLNYIGCSRSFWTVGYLKRYSGAFVQGFETLD